ncbi:hypothetical protein [Paraglaciecola marina]|uniref:hypothetical protein n=1 Tax=Paraglaciecola marina TaxID=2500157 RepID=UPI00105E256C|nr:hypothetical protein [Paraglaciecola marina]
MKTVLKEKWHNKRVTVSIDKHYLLDGFNSSFTMRIKVDETSALPSRFIKGAIHKANKDIVETMGGLPNFIAQLLNDAAKQEYMRRTIPIKEQLSLF